MHCARSAMRRLSSFMLAACLTCLASGCASWTNPVLNGIPVRKLPPELLSQSRREGLQTVPLSLLRQKPPKDYALAAGDVLGVYISGVFPLTLADQPLTTPPVYFPSQIDPLGAGLPPSLGYPVTIRNDGTLALPLVDPISLDGLTIEQANQRVRDAYSEKGILQPGRESVMLTLMQPRQIRVMVFRQEVGGFAAGGRGDISTNNVKQGTGHVVDLRAYENDVVNALVNTGGLPGQDAYSGVFIFRGGLDETGLAEHLQTLSPGEKPSIHSELSVKVDYIPTRWPAGQPLPFEPETAVLHEGDVVFLESRTNDLFYTGGLLPAGERTLPRDYDLDVVEAVAQVRGTLLNGAFGGNNFNGLLIQKGIGNPNPSALTVIRRTPNGGQIPISVDLNRALVDPRERIIVQPGDVLILQERFGESLTRYLNDIFNFNVLVYQRGSASTSAAAPTGTVN
ncbi:MAG: polysaccharide biosynthesis/export family protein [Planctomycetales bacterium]|nr:polysaccharide biosynthesis/export family protein [Planctomycetales bacterium]